MNKLLKEFLSYIIEDKKEFRPGESRKYPGYFMVSRGKYSTQSAEGPVTHNLVGGDMVPVKGPDTPTGSKKGRKASQGAGTAQGQGTPSASQQQPTPKKRGRPPKQVQTIQSVTADIGEERVNQATERLSEILGPNSEGDGDQKLAVLEGKIKSAGQSATGTGPVHEVSIGLVMRVLSQDPQLTNEQVAVLVANHIKDTKLAQALGEKKLLDVVTKAAGSARAERTRVSIGIRNNGMNPETTVTDHYHGNGQSKGVVKKKVEALVANGVKIYTSDGIEIDPKDIPALIDEAGSSTHGEMTTPGDTFVLSIDPTTKKAILSTSSNKTERNDQSLNTTILKELTDYRNSLGALVESGALSQQDLEKVQAELGKTDATIADLSSQVAEAFEKPVQALANDEETQQKFIAFLTEPSDERTRKNLGKYYKTAIQPFENFNPKRRFTKDDKGRRASERHEQIKRSLEDAGWDGSTPVPTDVATKAWINDMTTRLADPEVGLTGNEAKMVERFFAASGGATIDTTQIRTKALEALQTRHAALSQIPCTIDGQNVTAGQAVLGIFAVRALHLQESFPNMPGNSPVYTKYKCYFKAVTGDIVGYPDANLAALGVSSFGELCSGLELSEPKIAAKTITFDIIRQTKEGQQRSLAYRVVRTKGGTALNITVVPSKDYTNALADNQPSPE